MAIPGFRILSREYQQYKPQATPMGVTPNLPASTTAETSAALTQQTSARIAQSMQQNTIQASAGYESLARAAQYSGASAPLSSSNIGGNIAALGLGIAEVFTKVQEAKQKKAEEERKAALEQANVDYLQEAQDLASDAASITRGEGGSFRYRNAVQELVNRYQLTGLSAEQLAPGLGLMFDQHRQEQARADADLLEQAKTLTEQTRGTDLARMQLAYVSKIGGLSAGISDAAQQQLSAEVMEMLSRDLASTDPLTGQMLAESVINQLSTPLLTASQQSQALRNSIQALTAAQQVDRQAFAEYQRTGDLAEYNRVISGLKLGMPEDARNLFTPAMNSAREQQDFLQKQASYAQQLSNQPIPFSSDLDLPTLKTTQLGAVAYLLANNPNMIANIEAQYKVSGVDLNGAELPPSMAEAVSLATRYREFTTTEESKLKEDILQQEFALASLQKSDVTEWFRFRQSTEQAALGGDPVIQTLQTLFSDKLGTLDTGVDFATLPPEEKARLQEEWARYQAEAVALKQRQIAATQATLDQRYREFSHYGLFMPDGNGRYVRTQMNTDEVFSQTQAVIDKLRNVRQAQMSATGGLQPNFNMPQLHTQLTPEGKELVFPFRPQANFDFFAGQLYGAPRDGGARAHQGLDFGVPIGTEIVSYVGGKVTRAEEAGGYGLVVEVTAPDGTDHFFAHLSALNVSEGQIIQPGDVLAYSGNTGNSPDEHLHWEVRTADDKHLNPLEYAAQIPRQLRQQRGAEPRVTPNGVVNADGSSYVTNMATAMAGVTTGAVSPTEFSNRNPVRQSFASSNKADYQFNPAHNYGYAALRDNRLRTKFHDIAKKNNIPAQWLADIIQKESNWNPGAENPHSGASGLIQFLPGTIAEYGVSAAELRSMDAERQLDYVNRYLQSVRSYAGEFETPDQLLVGIFLGMGTLREYKENPRAYLDSRDGTGYSLRNYLLELGRDAGRQYRTPATRTVTHTSYVQGCPSCEQMAYGGFTVPHEAIL